VVSTIDIQDRIPIAGGQFREKAVFGNARIGDDAIDWSEFFGDFRRRRII